MLLVYSFNAAAFYGKLGERRYFLSYGGARRGAGGVAAEELRGCSAHFVAAVRSASHDWIYRSAHTSTAYLRAYTVFALHFLRLLPCP